MSAMFEELDYSPTAMGDLSLRRRRALGLDIDVLEVKLGDEFLMSSLFTEGERALARLGLAECAGESLDVLGGGLGLGYTAAEALKDARVRSLVVIEALEPVIRWHREGLVPLGERLTADRRCELRLDDFFAVMGQAPDETEPRFDAILLDIDHSPNALLHAPHGRFYSPDGQQALARWLKPQGVFAMWSDEGPDAAFMTVLAAAFDQRRAEVVTFANPLTGGQSSCTIYIGRNANAPARL
jgi:spermidine synthase